MRFLFILIILITFVQKSSSADEVSIWLKKEIDIILQAYSNENISNEKKFSLIEGTINYNFAGSGIAKFVSGKAWEAANKSNKEKYVKLFKKHLALSVASMMQGYSNQNYELKNSSYDSKNKVSLIDMEIFSETGNLVVTWRVKKSKDRFYVIDLLIADISLVVTKRSEFNSMLKNINYELSQLNLLLENKNKDSYNKLIAN